MKALLVGPNSFVIRNWVTTGLADELAEEFGADLRIMSFFPQSEFVTPAGLRIPNVPIAVNEDDAMDAPYGMPRSLRLLRYLRLRLFALDVPDGSVQMMALARRKDFVNRALRVARALAPRRSPHRAFFRTQAQRYGGTTPAVGEVIAEERPDFVIVGSPGYFLLDEAVAREAQRRRIPVHCVVNSWDNLSSRGPLFVRPSSLMVWNEHMREQAQTIHGYPSSRTHVVGALQFAPYAKPLTDAETDGAFQRLGLQPGTPYVLYLSGQHAPEYEAEDGRALADALDRAGLEHLRIVVRPHPQSPRSPFQAIQGGRVLLDSSHVLSSKGSAATEFGLCEIRSMAALIANSKAVVASWATTGLLEAAIFDRPVIQLRWMDALPRSKPEQVRKMRDLESYAHLKPFDACGSRVFSDSPATVAELVKQALAEPERLRDARRKAVESFASPPLAMAPKRICAALKTYVCGSGKNGR